MVPLLVERALIIGKLSVLVGIAERLAARAAALADVRFG